MEVHGKTCVPLGAVLEFASEALTSFGGEENVKERMVVQQAITSGQLQMAMGQGESISTLDLTISNHQLHVACMDIQSWHFQASINQCWSMSAVSLQRATAATVPCRTSPFPVSYTHGISSNTIIGDPQRKSFKPR
jgi:hypothetical protein